MVAQTSAMLARGSSHDTRPPHTGAGGFQPNLHSGERNKGQGKHGVQSSSTDRTHQEHQIVLNQSAASKANFINDGHQNPHQQYQSQPTSLVVPGFVRSVHSLSSVSNNTAGSTSSSDSNKSNKLATSNNSGEDTTSSVILTSALVQESEKRPKKKSRWDS